MVKQCQTAIFKSNFEGFRTERIIDRALEFCLPNVHRGWAQAICRHLYTSVDIVVFATTEVSMFHFNQNHPGVESKGSHPETSIGGHPSNSSWKIAGYIYIYILKIPKAWPSIYCMLLYYIVTPSSIKIHWFAATTGHSPLPARTMVG